MRRSNCQGSTAQVLVLGLLLVFPALAFGQKPASPPAPGSAPRYDCQSQLERVRRLYEQLEYERASEELIQAERLARTEDELVQVALFRGLIYADRGQRKEALSSFRAALTRRPTVQLPTAVSPKVAQDFELVREEVLRARAQGGTPTPTGTPPPSDRPVRPGQQPAVATPLECPPQAPAFQPGLSQAPPRSRVILPVTLLGSSVLAGGVGAYFGMQSRDHVQGAREAEFREDRIRTLREARTSARMANILFGAAGAAAAGALAAFVFQGSDAPREGGTP